jgi:hypothetical protein
MTHHSEERLPDSAPGNAHTSSSARILPFERPQSDLQRAIQLRAQEAIDLDRDRDREKKKPQPLRWIIITAIALIPVVLIFGAVDGFLRAFYRINESYKSEPAPQPPPVAEPEQPQVSEPGVVLLQPYGSSSPSETAAPESAAQSPPSTDTPKTN